MNSVHRSAPIAPFSGYAVGVSVVVWLGLAVCFVVPTPLSPSRNPLGVWLAILGGCGAISHALLLSSARFRCLHHLGRMLVLWSVVMLLLGAVRIAAGPLGSPTSAAGLLVAGAVFGAVPAFAACAVATWFVERAEA